MAETKDKPKEKRALNAARMVLAESAFNTWRVVPEAGTTIEEMLDPAYWAHCSRTMRPDDIVSARAEEGSYFAEFLVQDAGMNFAKVALLRKVDLTPTTVEGGAMGLAGHTAEWSGPYTKWRVLRDSDRKILKDGFASRSDANAWIAGHARAMVA